MFIKTKAFHHYPSRDGDEAGPPSAQALVVRLSPHLHEGVFVSDAISVYTENQDVENAAVPIASSSCVAATIVHLCQCPCFQKAVFYKETEPIVFFLQIFHSGAHFQKV